MKLTINELIKQLNALDENMKEQEIDSIFAKKSDYIPNHFKVNLVQVSLKLTGDDKSKE